MVSKVTPVMHIQLSGFGFGGLEARCTLANCHDVGHNDQSW